MPRRSHPTISSVADAVIFIWEPRRGAQCSSTGHLRFGRIDFSPAMESRRIESDSTRRCHRTVEPSPLRDEICSHVWVAVWRFISAVGDLATTQGRQQ